MRNARGVRAAYVLVLLLATLSNLALSPHDLAERARRMLDPSLSARDAVDALRNVALFAGWGLVWMLTAPSVRSRAEIAKAVLSGALISLTVELLQLASSTRTASVLDVATNTTGALLGAITLGVAVEGLRRRRGRKSFVGIPAGVFALGYGAAVATEALVPLFRQATAPGAYGGPLHRMAAVLAAFDWSSLLRVPAIDFLLFLPAGVLGVAAWIEAGDRGYRQAASRVAVAGVLGSAAVEVGHGFLGIPIQLGAMFTHAAAIAAGAALAIPALPFFTRALRGRSRPRLLSSAYAVVLLLWMLRPYRPVTSISAVAEELGRGWWIPLRAQGLRMDVFSVGDVFAGFMLFLPLGPLLAVWPVRRRGVLAGPLPGIYLAFTAELFQFLVAGRTVDVTDPLVQSAALAAGWVMARRAGFPTYGVLWPKGSAVSRAGPGGDRG